MLWDVGEVPRQFAWISHPEIGKINSIIQWKIDHSKLTKLGCVCNLPCWVWFRLHIFHTAIDWHCNWHVQQWRCCSHCVTIVFVIDFDVSMRWLTFPITDKLEWSWLSTRFSLYRILQNVNVEIGCRWILFRLTTKQLRKGGHVELEDCSSAWRLDFVTAKADIRLKFIKLTTHFKSTYRHLHIDQLLVG